MRNLIKISTYALYNTLLELEKETKGLILNLSKMKDAKILHWSDQFNKNDYRAEFNAMTALSLTGFTQSDIAMHCCLLSRTKRFYDLHKEEPCKNKDKRVFLRVKDRRQFIQSRVA
jgi:hypothetical protein